MTGTGGFFARLQRASRYGCVTLPSGKDGAGLITEEDF